MEEKTHTEAPPPLAPVDQTNNNRWSSQKKNSMIGLILAELKVQRGITAPMLVLYVTWYSRYIITTAFLGRLGQLSLAGGALAVTLSNVTGFSVLNGLSAAMEPICGQAFGAKNYKLLHKTLIMAIILQLLVTLPISFLWLNVHKILTLLGQQGDISMEAKKYLLHLLPDLVVYAFLCPLKAYLSCQSITVPIMLSSALGLAVHVPINVLLSRTRGLVGVAMAVWMSDLVVLVLLALYVFVPELKVRNDRDGTWKERGWWEQGVHDWKKLLKLSGSCCLSTCIEWWCYEILILMAGRLPNAKQAVGVLVIIIEFDYFLYALMSSLATCASIRTSNELGANRAVRAYQSAYISLGIGALSGLIGASLMVATRGLWGRLFTHDREIANSVERLLLILVVVEVFNFPLQVCLGILRGTARPKLGFYANVTGFYLLALPVGAVLTFKLHLGIVGILTGFLVGTISCLIMLLFFIIRINWDEEAIKATILNSTAGKIEEHEDCKNLA